VVSGLAGGVSDFNGALVPGLMLCPGGFVMGAGFGEVTGGTPA